MAKLLPGFDEILPRPNVGSNDRRRSRRELAQLVSRLSFFCCQAPHGGIALFLPREMINMRTTNRLALIALFLLAVPACTRSVPSIDVPAARARLALTPEMAGELGTQGVLEIVAMVNGPMPTGVAVSRSGRTFLSFPRLGDKVAYTVAELKDGRASAFPSEELQAGNTSDPGNKLVSVQSLVVDPDDRLWLLDTGSTSFGDVPEGTAKLIAYDLGTNSFIKTIRFPRSVVFPTSYLTDVRIDLRHGTQGMAYISDSSDRGPNGIIVVDLATGRSWRKLNDHPSTKAMVNFVPNVEGRALMEDESGQPRHLKTGIDGIALSEDNSRLYYNALASRRLYSVSTDALSNEYLPEIDVARTIDDLGDKGFASDGLESDSEGNLYLTDYEHNAIRRRSPDGRYSVVASNRTLIWPDSLSVGPGGYLYVTANQLDRSSRYNQGMDRREPPYALFRTKIQGQQYL